MIYCMQHSTVVYNTTLLLTMQKLAKALLNSMDPVTVRGIVSKQAARVVITILITMLITILVNILNTMLITILVNILITMLITILVNKLITMLITIPVNILNQKLITLLYISIDMSNHTVPHTSDHASG